MRTLVLGMLLLVLGGCARYEFDVLEPPDLAQRIGREEPAVVPWPPVEYRLRSAEGRLVMTIHNPDGQMPVTLLGDESYVVDPDGESHPFRAQTIAPSSFIKLILPPRPPVYRATPTYSIGIGYGYYHRYPRAWYPYYYPFDYDYYYPYGPRYFSVNDESGDYWSWTDEQTIRMLLKYEKRDEKFTHQFVIQRVKVQN